MGDKAVLVIMLHENCGHCRSFKRDLPHIKLAVEGLGVKIFEVEFRGKKPLVPKVAIPESLKVYTRWFPILILIPGNKWEEALNNKTTKINLNGEIFGGFMNSNGVPEPATGSFSRDQTTIVNWIKSTLANPKFGSSRGEVTVKGAITPLFPDMAKIQTHQTHGTPSPSDGVPEIAASYMQSSRIQEPTHFASPSFKEGICNLNLKSRHHKF
jgi:hypothetical protein